MLTAIAVRNAGPKHAPDGTLARNEIADGTGLGLYLAIEVTGAKSWVRRYRLNDRSHRKTLGSAGDGGLTLIAARAAAAEHAKRCEQGLITAPARTTVGESVAATVAEFLELHVARKTRASTATGTIGIFNRVILPAWRGRALIDIRRRDVIDLVERVAADHGHLSNRTLAALSKFFNWCCARDLLVSSPAQGVERCFEEKARDRTLTDNELRALWLAAEGVFGDAFKLMVLTGARRNEVGRMCRSEIDEKDRQWVLPGERTKNHRQHIVPLSVQAWSIVQARPRFLGCDFVFSIDGKRPINNWAEDKRNLSHKARIALRSWRLHDLRRTCASGMQKIGVAVPVIEKALNHQGGAFRGIVGTYQTHDYADEVRDALQHWADYVEQLMGGGRSGKAVKRR